MTGRISRKLFSFIILLSTLVTADALAVKPVALDMQKESTRIRKEYKLEPQKLDEKCCKIAQDWAEYMAKHHYHNHGGGENIIAVGYKDVPSVFGGWMSSSGHRYWVLSDSDMSGWGAAKSSTGIWYWAGAFRKTKKESELDASTYITRRRFRLFRRRR